MYAIMESGGKQYKVSPEDELMLEKIEGKPGKKIEISRVLMLAENGKIKVGKDAEKAKVKATIVEQTRGAKVIVFKYKSKKNYRRKRGHRQFLTKVRIDEIIGLSKGPAKAKATASKTRTKPKTAAEKRPAGAEAPSKAKASAKTGQKAGPKKAQSAKRKTTAKKSAPSPKPDDK